METNKGGNLFSYYDETKVLDWAVIVANLLHC